MGHRCPIERATGPATTLRPWWGHITWLLGASVLGFGLPALVAGAIHLSRGLIPRQERVRAQLVSEISVMDAPMSMAPTTWSPE